MSAQRNVRPHGMTEQALVDAIQAWRKAYETDPLVTHYTIAAAIGVTQPTVSKRVRRLGWVVPEAVARTRKGAKPKVSSKARYRVERCLVPPRGHAQACAPASVFQFALGRLVTTVRHGGRHIEVSA